MTTNDDIETIIDPNTLEAVDGGWGGLDCVFYMVAFGGLAYYGGAAAGVAGAVLSNPLYDRYCGS